MAWSQQQRAIFTKGQRSFALGINGVVLCCFTVAAVFTGVVAAHDDSLAKAGQLADYDKYMAVSLLGAVLTALILLLTLSIILRPGLVDLNRIARVVAVAYLATATVYAALQVGWHSRDLLMARLADKCAMSDVQSVRLLGLKVTCHDSEAYLYPVEYVKKLPSIIAFWTIPLLAVVAAIVIVAVRARRAGPTAVEEGEELLSEERSQKP